MAHGDGGGLAEMGYGIDELVRGGWLTRSSFYRCILAEALLTAGETDRAEACLKHALSSGRLRQERWCHPELFRVLGLVRAARGDESGAERLYEKAVRSATSMQARSLELRVHRTIDR